MINLFLSKENTDGTVLSLSPLCNKHLAASGRSLDDSAGYFLYQSTPCDPDSIKILARVETDDQALEMRELLGLE